MDVGEWLKLGFYLRPAQNGSFVIHRSNEAVGSIGKAIAFTNVEDLLKFLIEEKRGFLGGEGSKEPSIEEDN